MRILYNCELWQLLSWDKQKQCVCIKNKNNKVVYIPEQEYKDAPKYKMISWNLEDVSEIQKIR